MFVNVQTYATNRFDHGAAGIDLLFNQRFTVDTCREAESKLKHIKRTATVTQVAVNIFEPQPVVFVDSNQSVDCICSYPYKTASNQIHG